MAKKNKFQSIVEEYKSLKGTDRGKGILFLGRYFIFFVVLFLIFNIGGTRNTTLPEDYELNSSGNYSVDKILNENYNFKYTIDIDNNLYIYSGERKENIEYFTFNGIQYYHNTNNYFTNNNGMWISTTNPYIYTEFLDFNRLGEIIVDATYISKTEFDSGKTLFNYQLSTNSLMKRIENIDTDIMEVPNNIVFTAGSDSVLNKIELDLSSYGKFKGICTNNFRIILEYSNFGGVDEIVNPID